MSIASRAFDSDSASTATMRSFAPADSGTSAMSPASPSIFRLASVAIIAEAFFIPGSAQSFLLSCMSLSESW